MTKTALLLASVLLAACGDSPAAPAPDTPSPAAFTATAIRGTGRVLAGKAVFTLDADGAQAGFLASLEQAGPTTGSVRHAIYLGRTVAGLPPVGEYPLRGDSAAGLGFLGAVILDADAISLDLCIAVEGRVRILQSTALRVRGEFRLQARCAPLGLPSTDLPLEVSGTFDAAPGVVAPLDDVAPVAGRYQATAVNGGTLPVIIEDTTFTDSTGTHRLVTTVESGRIDLQPDGRYQQEVTLRGEYDGVRNGTAKFRDTGFCVREGTMLRCESGYYQHRGFVARLEAGAFVTEQDVDGRGDRQRFRYLRQ